MKLPNKFQFRLYDCPGYTHSISLNAHGDYEVKWARGWAHEVNFVPNVVFTEDEVKAIVENKLWFVVDKKEEVKLPDEFYFQVSPRLSTNSLKYKAAKRVGGYKVTWDGDNVGVFYDDSSAVANVSSADWIMYDKRPLTAEEERRKKDFEERIAQLDQSIKLNEQSIEHYLRLVANYKAQQDDLRAKLKEMES